jgi:hypothetical protein
VFLSFGGFALGLYGDLGLSDADLSLFRSVLFGVDLCFLFGASDSVAPSLNQRIHNIV